MSDHFRQIQNKLIFPKEIFVLYLTSNNDPIYKLQTQELSDIYQITRAVSNKLKGVEGSFFSSSVI